MTAAHGRGNRLVGVGVGPGDPELITVKAANLLATADVVFVPVTESGQTGRAEQAVLFYAEAWRVHRVVFAVHGAQDGGQAPADAAARQRAGDAAAAGVARWFARHPGGTAVFATIGDPCVYSAFPALADAVRAAVGELAVEFVPGITAMQQLAARTGSPLVTGGESLALFATAGGTEGFRAACARGDAVVADRFGALLPQALAVLRETGRLGDAVYGAGLGMVAEDVRPAGALDPAAPRPYLSTLIVRAPRRRQAGPR